MKNNFYSLFCYLLVVIFFEHSQILSKKFLIDTYLFEKSNLYLHWHCHKHFSRLSLASQKWICQLKKKRMLAFCNIFIVAVQKSNTLTWGICFNRISIFFFFADCVPVCNFLNWLTWFYNLYVFMNFCQAKNTREWSHFEKFPSFFRQSFFSNST